MFEFTAEQKTARLGHIEIGGQIGERPPALVGSIFYSGHRIVSDPVEGIFDAAKASDLLDQAEALSAQYAMPHIPDVIAESEQAMRKYIDFVAGHCDAPFLVDSTNHAVRLAGMQHAADVGVLDRAIYNSIDPHTTLEEMATLRRLGVKNAVILAFSTDHLFPKDRIALLKGDDQKPGLLNMAQEAGIENLMIDPGVLDLPSTSWTARAIHTIKDEIGFPAGCAPSNALYTWKRTRQIKSPDFEACGAAVFGLPLAYGADFILYGPIANASWVFPSAAVTSAMTGYGLRLLRKKTATKNHPLYTIFK